MSGGYFPDYELLELLLFYTHPRKDTKPYAKKLLQQFQSISQIVNTKYDDLVKTDGITDQTIVLFRLIQEIGARLLREEICKNPVIGSEEQVIQYCHMMMAHLPIEQFRALFLNKKNMLIKDCVMQEGTIDNAAVYPREIAKLALDLRASAVIVVHNHPTGNPTPSQSDIEITREIKNALGVLDIALYDHIIVGRYGHVSFRRSDLL